MTKCIVCKKETNKPRAKYCSPLCYSRSWRKLNLIYSRDYQKNYHLKYYPLNKDRIHKLNKIYQSKHKEKYRQRFKKYYEEHKEYFKLKGSEWEIKNRERRHEINRKTYQKNREKILKWQRDYRIKLKEMKNNEKSNC